jgi:hypothetical protein
LKPIFKSLLVLTAALFSSTVSQADTTAVATGTFQSFHDADSSSSASAKIGYGFGGLFDRLIVGNVGFQAGLLYLLQKQVLTGGTLSRPLLQIPVTLQFHLTSVLSIGAGAYYTHTVSDDTFTNTLGGSNSASSTDLGYKSSDTGAIVNVAIHIPLPQAQGLPKVSFLAVTFPLFLEPV